eukprot:TRINITY_DN21437_c0_g1_i1.p1 TRINITY_DN21437_c0_g1~~TRINITY_DN21437_c0_g1_i1.p1  ORF type:complete len:715 (-),score=181.86 TRINITY_DN21437_c0_g1_i1:506-2650(-)
MRKTVQRLKSTFGGYKAAAAALEVETANAEISIGSLCIVKDSIGGDANAVPLSADQDPASEIVANLPCSTALEVEEIADLQTQEDGAGQQRCRVLTYAGQTGWLDLKTVSADGTEQLFLERNNAAQVTPAGLAEYCKLDTDYLILIDTTVTEAEDRESPSVMDATVGSTCRVLEVSETDRLRLKVAFNLETGDADPQPTSGWIDLISPRAELMLGTEEEAQPESPESLGKPLGPRARAAAAARQAKEAAREKASALKERGKTRLKSIRMPGNMGGIKEKVGGRMKSVFGKKSSGHGFCCGDLCEAVSVVKVFEGDCLNGSMKAELGKGSAFEIIDINGDSPDATTMKILTYTDISGWCCVKADGRFHYGKKYKIKKSLRALVAPQAVDDTLTLGEEYEVIMQVDVRATEEKSSAVSLKLETGQKVKLLDVVTGNHQAKVQSPDTYGYISLVNEKGEWFIGDPCGKHIEPFLEAARIGDLDTMKLMVETMHFDRPDCTNSKAEGMTALMYAAAAGYKDVVVHLLFSWEGVNVNHSDDHGQTALHHACMRMSADRNDEYARKIIDLLLQKSANVNSADHMGKTSLMQAAAAGDNMIVAALLDHKALVVIKDQDSMNAIDHANNAFGRSCAEILSAKLAEQEAAGLRLEEPVMQEGVGDLTEEVDDNVGDEFEAAEDSVACGHEGESQDATSPKKKKAGKAKAKQKGVAKKAAAKKP